MMFTSLRSRSIAILFCFAALTSVLRGGDEETGGPPEGFVALFNGEDLSGWKGQVGNPQKRAAMSSEELAELQKDADRLMRRHWKARDGELVFSGQGNNLCTVRDYGNFELYLDWKIEPHGESGVYLRGSPQIQIWDPGDWRLGRGGSGGLFNNLRHASEALVRADRPVGEWNTFYVWMLGDRVTVKLNDKLVVDDTVLENYWERDQPIYQRGSIELQSHGGPVRFRNLYLRELPAHPSPQWESLFDGADLDRWDFQRRGWRIEDDVLAVSQRRRETERDNTIWTKERFDDFILDLEFKLAAGSNSGIFIRTADRENWLHTGIEIQLIDSYAQDIADKHACGAVYDVLAPTRNAVLPPEEWNRIVVVAQDNLLSVVLNGQHIADLDLNLWTEPHRNPDGTENKFDTAYRDMPRSGFIGFQDHGTPISFRNVRIKRLARDGG